MKFWLLLSLLLVSVAHAQLLPSRFQVQDRRILAPDKSEWIPNGTNIGLWGDHSREDDVDAIKSKWGFNTVLLPVFLAAPAGAENLEELIDRTVESFTQLSNGPRVVVVISPFDRRGEFYRDGETPGLTDLLAFWKRMATRYASNPYVWFNIQNAPGSGQLTREWFDVHRRAIQTIRATGAANPIVCDGHNFGSEETDSQTLPALAKDSGALFYGRQLLELDPAKNLIFGFHPGRAWSYSGDKMGDFLRRAHAKNLTIMAMSYGVSVPETRRPNAFLKDSFQNDTSQAAHFLMEWAREKPVGRLVWHYGDGETNALTTARWGTSTGRDLQLSAQGQPLNLTWLGELAWNSLRGQSEPNLGASLNRFRWRARASVGAGAANAIDSDVASSWSLTYPNPSLAPRTEKADWLQIDLGAAQKFDGLRLETRRFAANFARDLKIYAGNDEQNLALVGEIENNAQSTIRAQFPPQTARFVRVSGSRFGRDWGKNRDLQPAPTFISWSVSDFQLFNSGVLSLGRAGQTPLPREQWSASATARTGWHRDWEGAAIDGDPRTRYLSGRALQKGDEFVVDMKAAKTISTLRFDSGLAPEAYARKFQIYTSLDGLDWGEPLVSDLGNAVTLAILPGPTRARYFKIVCAENASTPWVLSDIQAFSP